MLPKGLKPLAEMRMAGIVPPGSVWVLFGDYEQATWWQWSGVSAELALPEDSPVARIDFRPLVGLSVCVQADRYGPQLLKLCERLKEFCRSLTVFVLAWLPDSIGMFWDRGQVAEWRSFDEEVAA